MPFLRPLADLEVAWLGEREVGAVLLFDNLLGFGLRLLGNAHRVGAHVGNQTDRALLAELDALVQLLRHAHRLAHRKAHASRRRLLQLRGGEGRLRFPLARLGLHLGDGPLRTAGGEGDDVVFLVALDGGVGAPELGEDGEGFLLAPDGYLVAVLALQLRLEGGRLLALEVRLERPVFLRYESLDLALPVHHQPQRHRLHAAGGDAAPHLVPEQRRELVAHDAIQDAPRLLCLDPVDVDLAGVVEGPLDAVLGDLFEQHPHHRLVAGIEELDEMPADGLTLAVRVRGDVDGVRFLGGTPQLADDLLLVLDGRVGGLEAVVDIDGEPLLGQIAHVSHRRLHVVGLAQIAVDGACLRRGLDDDQ